MPIIVWSPANSDNCLSTFNSLDDFRKQVPGFEANGQQMDRTLRAVFKAPELSRYELLQPIPSAPGAQVTPAAVSKLLGWSEEEARTAGAYPAQRIGTKAIALKK